MDEQQYDLELTERVKTYAKEIGSALVGIADAGILNEALEPDFRPEDLLPGCRCVVVLSLHIPDGALEIMRHGKMNYSYNMFGYAYLNRELDFLIYRMTMFLEMRGMPPCRSRHAGRSTARASRISARCPTGIAPSRPDSPRSD